MSRQEPGPAPTIESQRPTHLAPAIPLEEVGRIAERVQELIAAGNEAAAWQRLRQLHPADVGLILAGLPRASSEALLEIMSPQTVTWVLRHMNPVEASPTWRATEHSDALLCPRSGQSPPRPHRPAETPHSSSARGCRTVGATDCRERTAQSGPQHGWLADDRPLCRG